MARAFSNKSFSPSLLQGIVAYWKFDDNSNDSVGGFNGTDTDVTYSLLNGKINQGAGFNGTTSKVIISTGAGSPFRQSSAMTYSFWAKFAPGESLQMGVASTGGQGSGGVQIDQGTGNALFLWTPTNPASDNYYFTTLGAINTDWHHYCFTISFSGFTTGIWYIDGVIKTTTIAGGVVDGTPQTSYNTVNGDAIGARYVNSFTYNSCKIDEVGIWSRVLTNTEAMNLYNSGSGNQYSFSSQKTISSKSFSSKIFV